MKGEDVDCLASNKQTAFVYNPGYILNESTVSNKAQSWKLDRGSKGIKKGLIHGHKYRNTELRRAKLALVEYSATTWNLIMFIMYSPEEGLSAGL